MQVAEAQLLLKPVKTSSGMETALLLTPALSVMIVQPCGILLHYSITNKQPLLEDGVLETRIFTLGGTLALMLPLILSSISLDEVIHSWFKPVMSHYHSLVQFIQLFHLPSQSHHWGSDGLLYYQHVSHTFCT
jgi:hypothetical protein